MGKTRALRSKDGTGDTAPPSPAQELDKLIREQGVKPMTDFSVLYNLWPEGSDPDDLLRFLERYRAEQRALEAEKRR